MKITEKQRAYGAAYRAANRERERARSAAWRTANPEKSRAQVVAWQANNTEKIKADGAARYADGGAERHRMKKYGVSPDCFTLMLAVQQNACGICEEIFSKEPHIDHNHSTGEVRGLLCQQCNLGLGHFKDSSDLLRGALEYLQT